MAERNQAIQKAEFDDSVNDLIDRLKGRLNLYERGLRGTRGAIIAMGADSITREQFLDYIDSRDMAKEFPGAHGIGFIRLVEAGQEKTFVARMHREGFTDFKISELSQQKGEHFIVQLIEPLAFNRQSLGLDISSEQSRRASALRAAQSGEATLTAPITLVQAQGKPKQGFLLLLPVYRSNAIEDMSNKELSSMYGWTFSPLVIDEVLADFDSKDYAFRLTDVTDTKSPVSLLKSSGTGHPDGLKKRVMLNLYGRDWAVYITASEEFIKRLNLSSPNQGTGIILLIFSLFAMLHHYYLRNIQRDVEDKLSAQLGAAAPEAMMAVNDDGFIVHVNQRFAEMFGYTIDELRGSRMEILLPESIRQSHIEDRSRYDRVPRTMGRGRYLMAQRKNGETFPVEVSLGPLESGGKRQTIAMVVDITQRNKMELALSESERKFRTLASNIPGMLYRGDAEGRTEFISHSVELCGYTNEELQEFEDGWLHIIHPEDRERVIHKSLPLTKEESSLVQEYRILHKNGETRWVSDHKQSLFDEDERFAGVDGVVFDVTVTKRAEHETALTKERLRRGQMFANIGTWDWNIRTGKLYWSERIAPLFGYPLGDLDTTYENFLNAVHPDDRQKVIDAVNACVESDVPYEIEHRVVWPDGTVRWLLERGAVIRDATGQPLQMLGVVMDIHDRKMAQESLRKSEEHLVLFERIFNASEHAIFISDPEGNLVYINPAFQSMFKYPEDELSGMNISRLVAQSDMPQLQQLLSEVLNGKAWLGLMKLKRKDGEEFTASNTVGAIRDEDGKPRYLFNIFYDYEPELARQNELLAARDTAEAANRAKSDFLSSMSHELRTPLNAVIGFGQLLESDDNLDEDQRDSLKEIIKAGLHLLELVNEVLDLSKIESGNIDLSLEPVFMKEVCEECCNLVKPMADKKSISISSVNCGDVHVRADRIRLKQVLLNLLSNAVKYNREGGSITITKQDGRQGYLRLAVIDTGKGIAAARMEELFQPFNRLDEEFSTIEGTGIGLSITRRLIEMMGGMIGAESEAGVGSTFWIELPETDGHRIILNNSSEIDENHDMPGQHTVLYVEDNPVNLKLVSQIMGRRPNVKLLTAHTPELGFDMAKARSPDLILLDINMPGMDGYKLLKRMRAEAGLSQTPVVAVTANAMPRDIERGLQAGFNAYMTKPLDIDVFLKTIDGMLLEATKRDSEKEISDV